MLKVLQEAVDCGGINDLAAVQVSYDRHQVTSSQAVLALCKSNTKGWRWLGDWFQPAKLSPARLPSTR